MLRQNICSLKKFISRRDCPLIILSDIGTAFIAELTQNFAAICNIKWKISLTEAPWFGGFWERLVSPAKRSMKETLRNSTDVLMNFRFCCMKLSSYRTQDHLDLFMITI